MKKQLYNTFKNLSKITQGTISRYRVDVRHIQQLEQSITINSSNQAMLDGINELSKYLKHPEYSYLANKSDKHLNIVLDNRAGLPGRHYIHSRGMSSKIIDGSTR